MSEPLIQLLAELPSAEPDRARAEKIRMACRTRLVRQAPRTTTLGSRIRSGRTVQVWQPLVAALGVAYLTEVIVQAVRAYGAP